ncbi:hypothetical protein [Mesorhizobium sp. L2C084A000]|uniref:hypothetical protein n=1 Tax=unclassified Mesorhizobium TaxID=325217 RepID=UPI0012DD4B0F|nr:hypothetical protein [Mesorhizobium sp. L2C084A000]
MDRNHTLRPAPSNVLATRLSSGSAEIEVQPNFEAVSYVISDLTVVTRLQGIRG